MDFDRFTRRAEEILADIPAEYLAGVTGVDAHRQAKPHPSLPDIFTLGECGDDEAARLSDPGGLRSRIHLYHGSFAALARGEPGFDWEGELRETILHEVRHHLEDRAGLLDLIEEDALAEALARWRAGEDLRPGWHRAGEELEPGVFAVLEDLFVEVPLRPRELARLRGTEIELTVLDEPLAVEVPDDAEPGETLTFPAEGLEGPDGACGDLHVILGPR